MQPEARGTRPPREALLEVNDLVVSYGAIGALKGITLSVGNQLFRDLYGSLSWGHYTRKINAGGTTFDNKKSILSAKAAYNLAGVEVGGLAQWVSGSGDPTESGTSADIKQYRLKVFVQANF